MPRLMESDFADSPIPEKAIRLADAFKIVLEGLIVKPEIFATLEKNWDRHLDKSEEQDDPEVEAGLAELDGTSIENRKKMIRRSREANVFFRDHLSNGAIIAHVRDPQTGEILQLSPLGWYSPFAVPKSSSFRWIEQSIPTGIDNFVAPDDPSNPGPEGTFIRGAFQPVFFFRNEFDQWLETTFGPNRHPGRARGPGSIKTTDKCFLGETDQLIERGKANFPDDVANPRSRHYLAEENSLAPHDAKISDVQKVYSPRRNHRLLAAMKGLMAVYPDGPDGVMEDERSNKVNGWLRNNDRPVVSKATIRRAMRELRASASPKRS